MMAVDSWKDDSKDCAGFLDIVFFPESFQWLVWDKMELILILCAHLCISYCEFFLVLFQPGMKYKRLWKNSVIWASKSSSFTSCKLNSAIYFSDCCWERGREPSGAAAELSPLLPRTRPGSVHCTPLRAADKVYPGHGDAYRGEWNNTKTSRYDFVLCIASLWGLVSFWSIEMGGRLIQGCELGTRRESVHKENEVAQGTEIKKTFLL